MCDAVLGELWEWEIERKYLAHRHSCASPLLLWMRGRLSKFQPSQLNPAEQAEFILVPPDTFPSTTYFSFWLWSSRNSLGVGDRVCVVVVG